jgi:iron complex outermembrane recepter protein
MTTQRPALRRTKTKQILALSVSALSSIWMSAAGAQDFDYSGYEALFGEPVTEGVTGAPMRESQAPSAVTIITAQDIETSPSDDIAGLLTTVPGLSVVRRAMGQVDIGVRGFNEPKPRGLLVLVNGRQVYQDSYGSTDWEAIPVQKEEIKQIEVIRGPSGALYGFNAAEGVVNIITDNPLYDKGSFAVAEYGTQAETRFAGGITLPLGDDGGIRLTGGREDSNEFTKLLPPNPANDTDRQRIALNLDAAYRLSDSTDVRLEASHSEVQHTEVGPLFGVEDNSLETHSVKFDIEHELDTGRLSGTAYVNLLHDGVVENRVWVGQTEYLRKLGTHHTVRLSVEYRDNFTHQRGAPIKFGINYNVASAAVMWDWAIDENLTITNALRLDSLDLSATEPPPVGTPYTRAQYSRNITEPSFNSSIAWRPTELDQARVEVARGIKIPSLVDFGMAAPIPYPPLGYLFIGGDPSNLVTQVWNYEAGWSHLLTRLNASVDVTVFHTVRYDIIGAPGGVPDAVTPVGLSYLFKNRGDTESTGVTLEADGHVGPAWRWAVNYTNVDVNDRLTIPPALRAFYPTDYQDSQPQNEANAQMSFEQGRWLAGLEAHFQSESHELALEPTGFQPQDIKSFVDAGAKIGFRVIDHTWLSLSGTNLFQSAQRESSIGEIDRRIVVNLTAKF